MTSLIASYASTTLQRLTINRSFNLSDTTLGYHSSNFLVTGKKSCLIVKFSRFSSSIKLTLCASTPDDSYYGGGGGGFLQGGSPFSQSGSPGGAQVHVPW